MGHIVDNNFLDFLAFAHIYNTNKFKNKEIPKEDDYEYGEPWDDEDSSDEFDELDDF